VLRDRASGGGEAAELARAVAYHRQADTARALAGVDGLITTRPEDPYYHELRGQILLEAGRADEAASSYRRAAELAPKEPLILAGLGRALLNTGSDAATAEARDALARSVEREPTPGALRDLALAEARLGNDGAAALATAERFALQRDFADAARHAAHAIELLPAGSPGWRRAQDVITQARRALN
jgi:predicted Zn-dependent protease